MVRNTVADHMLKTERTNWSKRFKERQEKAKKEEVEAKDDTKSSKTEKTKPSPVFVNGTP